MHCDELEMTERERRDFEEMVMRFIVMSMLLSRTKLFRAGSYVGKGHADPFWSRRSKLFAPYGQSSQEGISFVKRANMQRKYSSLNGETESSKIDTSKPSAAPIASGGREYTISVALPGSIIKNVNKLEWKTNLAGQVFLVRTR
jgi:hypothetical protein